jgi:hypothetical protein
MEAVSASRARIERGNVSRGVGSFSNFSAGGAYVFSQERYPEGRDCECGSSGERVHFQWGTRS